MDKSRLKYLYNMCNKETWAAIGSPPRGTGWAVVASGSEVFDCANVDDGLTPYNCEFVAEVHNAFPSILVSLEKLDEINELLEKHQNKIIALTQKNEELTDKIARYEAFAKALRELPEG